MHHVARVNFGPSPTEIKAQSQSKKPLLRYFVDRREGLNSISPFEFLTSSTAFLHSPFSLPDILPALDLLNKTAESGGTILLYGDRDADGVTSSCLLGRFLQKEPSFSKANIQVSTATGSDPYGLSEPVMKKIKAVSPNLLITLDFGSSQPNEIDELRKLGTEVIVLDHHEIPTRIPEGSYCINPRRLDSQYPEKKICTAALSLKLIQALLFYKSDEFNKIYVKKEDSITRYFQNGREIFLEKENDQSKSQSEFNPFPQGRTKEDPTDDERFLFSFQTSQIPNFTDQILANADLASIGTVTDLMPLSGENRQIVKIGLQSLFSLYQTEKGEHRPGLFWLMKALNLPNKSITSKDLGWGLGPALNAAGRMGKTEVAVELLLSENAESAKTKASDLLKLNLERKDRTKRNLDRVERYFQRKKEKTEEPVAFCYEPDMEPGVSGIVATKMTEDFKKVSIFISPDNGDGRGSIRAYQRENVLEYLNAVSEHLLHFGGHPEAGGFSVSINKIPDLESALYAYGKSKMVSSKDEALADLSSDLTILPEELSESIVKEWKDLEPFGQGNPDIKLGLRNVRVYHLNPLSGGKHIRFHIIGSSIKCLLWNKGEDFEKYCSVTDTMDLIGRLEKNHFQGKESTQFIIEWFGKANPES